MQPGLNGNGTATFACHATIPSCRPGLPSQVLPDQDALVCQGNDLIQSRHLLMAAAEQSYGQFSLRTRQPFDFRGRTGRAVFDVEGQLIGNLHGWVSFAITEEPSPAPSFGVLGNFENGAVPRNGVEVHFFQLCNRTDRVGVGQVNVFRDYAETFYLDNEQGRMPTCVATQKGALNHFEVRVSRTHLEVWGTDRSSDGLRFGALTQLFKVDISLPFERGYVHITTHNHSTLKYSNGAIDAWTSRWDNVGFDGPVVAAPREYSIPDSLDPVTVNNAECRNIGYLLGDASEGPRQKLTFRGVDTKDVTQARLGLLGHFLMQKGNDYASWILRYRVNGKAWRDHRFDAAQLALLNGPNVFNAAGMNTRGDGSGIAGAISLFLEVDPQQLVDGDNTLEFVTSGVPYSYRPYVLNVDLLLTAP